MSFILVIEDSQDLRVLMNLALKQAGHRVQLAKNGKLALDLLLTLIENQGELPSLILLDLMMPVMNGWEFLDLKNANPDLEKIPTLVCSAAQPKDLQCTGFLKKPVDLPQLLFAVEKNKIA